ncbi:hypothetical protein GMA19_00850 [Paenibacillus polymyxa E681]|nr:hypothetical protein GE561_00851 [Paenibacillus polymyxa E681]QNV60534.1 hypothetical protein GMA19_00850 [Paenibacillus polymyxa E681]
MRKNSANLLRILSIPKYLILHNYKYNNEGDDFFAKGNLIEN